MGRLLWNCYSYTVLLAGELLEDYEDYDWPHQPERLGNTGAVPGRPRLNTGSFAADTSKPQYAAGSTTNQPGAQLVGQARGRCS